MREIRCEVLVYSSELLIILPLLLGRKRCHSRVRGLKERGKTERSFVVTLDESHNTRLAPIFARMCHTFYLLFI